MALVVPPVLVPLTLELPPVEALDALVVPPVVPFGFVEFWVAVPPPAESQAVKVNAMPSGASRVKLLIDNLSSALRFSEQQKRNQSPVQRFVRKMRGLHDMSPHFQFRLAALFPEAGDVWRRSPTSPHDGMTMPGTKRA